MNDEQRCVVVSRHPDPAKTPRAVPGLLVCKGHVAKIERMLAELPAMFDDLGSALTASEGARGERGKQKHGATAAGLSLNEPIVEARDEVHVELVRLVRYVAEERGFHVPADTVPALASWLTTQVDWLCARPDADETHDNLDRLTNSCYSLAFPSGRRRFKVPGAICGVPLFCDTGSREVQRCDGELEATLMPDDDRENLSEVVCTLCGIEVPLTAASLPQHWHAA